MEESMLEPDPALKPKLRGVSHQLAFFVAVLAGAFLVLNAADPQALTASLIYALCMTLMFGVSALRRPDPFPRTFGYHEVFHALVITGSALHFLAVIPLVCPG
jgi:predicted membrane channel-forming protein YqfA (hemolysin III family)